MLRDYPALTYSLLRAGSGYAQPSQHLPAKVKLDDPALHVLTDFQHVTAVIILAGLAAVGAALLGWFNAGFAVTDSDPIRAWHRWIGTALARTVFVKTPSADTGRVRDDCDHLLKRDE